MIELLPVYKEFNLLMCLFHIFRDGEVDLVHGFPFFFGFLESIGVKFLDVWEKNLKVQGFLSRNTSIYIYKEICVL